GDGRTPGPNPPTRGRGRRGALRLRPAPAGERPGTHHQADVAGVLLTPAGRRSHNSLIRTTVTADTDGTARRSAARPTARRAPGSHVHSDRRCTGQGGPPREAATRAPVCDAARGVPRCPPGPAAAGEHEPSMGRGRTGRFEPGARLGVQRTA